MSLALVIPQWGDRGALPRGQITGTEFTPT
jgi:hypothetical protein